MLKLKVNDNEIEIEAAYDTYGNIRDAAKSLSDAKKKICYPYTNNGDKESIDITVSFCV